MLSLSSPLRSGQRHKIRHGTRREQLFPGPGLLSAHKWDLACIAVCSSPPIAGHVKANRRQMTPPPSSSTTWMASVRRFVDDWLGAESMSKIWYALFTVVASLFVWIQEWLRRPPSLSDVVSLQNEIVTMLVRIEDTNLTSTSRLLILELEAVQRYICKILNTTDQSAAAIPQFFAQFGISPQYIVAIGFAVVAALATDDHARTRSGVVTSRWAYGFQSTGVAVLILWVVRRFVAT